MDLFVGRAFFEINEEAITAYLFRHGIDRKLIEGLDQTDTIQIYDLLNTLELVDHAIELEGYSDIRRGYDDLADGRFRLRHLPAWEESNWMPFEFNNPGLTHEGSITWVGSCHALLRELDDIASRSPLPLSEPPRYYQSMVDNTREIDEALKNGPIHSKEEMTRWGWCALRDGARLAIQRNSILSGTPE